METKSLNASPSLRIVWKNTWTTLTQNKFEQYVSSTQSFSSGRVDKAVESCFVQTRL